MSTEITGLATSAPTKPKTVRRTAQLPSKGVSLGALATTVAAGWQASRLPALLWLTKDDFAAQVAAFVANHQEADSAGDARAPQAKRLKALDKQLDAGLRYVKGYLGEQYDDEEAYYGEFGIEKVGKSYQLPTARPERVQAVGKLLAALRKHKFDKNKYGTAYWQPLYDEYQALLADATTSTGQRSGKVSQKDQGEAQVRKGLRALIHHIKANYPDTYEAELRGFGFQKETFGG
ncbi:hypothetical protein [Hymenobacter sp. CRA2]|uniref:hypothetical protein n=1 Tax=Hymenobacter sp. CRA2 TaxID=1955620 RepID=UPI00098F78E4|nr:hypothetical protein [Hymenobacter sp. CRA2]OON71126.1 hypothetical protein B0919_03810 [Hymenobacter sp. CRA2]